MQAVKVFNEDRIYKFSLIFVIFVYFWNFWINDIWIPNESFYAEAVREMFERKNFLDIYYNYELRFNKPPLTYWIIALSTAIFGITEFAIRLPIVIMGLGTLLFTYLISNLLFKNKKINILSVFIMAFTLQFVSDTRYASPEVPLAFFFSLTMYLFLYGYKNKNFKFILFAYISLGLTVLTKGFPYIVIIGSIVIIFLLLESNLIIKKFWKEFLFLKIWIGLPIVIVIGFWWYVYSYLKFGNQFWEVYYTETLGRALEKKTNMNIFEHISFYLLVVLWAFLPYSLTFYYSFITNLKNLKKLSFLFSWIIVMYLIFTIAKGKIPTYFIQAFPALSILTAYFIHDFVIKKDLKSYVFIFTLIFQSFIFLATSLLLIYTFNINLLILLIFLPVFIVFIKKEYIKLMPFLSALSFFFLFVSVILPKIEEYRPYDKIGLAIQKENIDSSVPLIIQNRFFHNLPFYAKRKVLRDYSLNQIKSYQEPAVVLVISNDFNKIGKGKVLWEGYLYNGGSESQFIKFIKAILKAEKGDFSEFTKYKLVYLE